MNLGKSAHLQTEDESGTILRPFDFEGVKAMSFGWVSPSKKAVLRGPMASSLLAQLLHVC